MERELPLVNQGRALPLQYTAANRGRDGGSHSER